MWCIDYLRSTILLRAFTVVFQLTIKSKFSTTKEKSSKLLINFNNSNAPTLNTAVVTFTLLMCLAFPLSMSQGISFNNRQMVSWFLISKLLHSRGIFKRFFNSMACFTSCWYDGCYYDHFIQYISSHSSNIHIKDPHDGQC